MLRELKMFWKPKDRKEPTLSKEAQNKKANSEISISEEDLAQQLQRFYQKQKEKLAVPEDSELEEVEAKVSKATKFLYDSGLEAAVGTIIPDHIKNWGAWSKQDNFYDRIVGFNAQNLKVREKDKNLYLNFVYNDSNYSVELKGSSYTDRSSSLVILLDNNPVLEINLFISERNNGLFSYNFDHLNKLIVGKWMQDILSMSAEIEAHELASQKKFDGELFFWKNPDKIKRAARNIQLQDDEK